MILKMRSVRYMKFLSLPRYKIIYRLFYWITIIGRIYQEKFVKKPHKIYTQ